MELRFEYRRYLESNGINTRPAKAPGFTLVVLGLGILLVVLKKAKK